MTDPAAIPGSAAEWFLAIYTVEKPEPEMLQAWLSWIEASEQNRKAFEDVVQIWHSTPAAVIARPASSEIADEYDDSVSIAEWRARKQAIRVGAGGRRDAGTRRQPLFAVAASLVLIAIAGLSYEILTPAVISTGQFATRTGQQLQLYLADDSRLTLGPHSKLTIDLKPDVRQVNLESGEAYFSVRKDPNRPFIVHALNGVITAVGTAFNVRAIEDRVTVTVTEGSVKVSDRHASVLEAATTRSNTYLLARDDQLTFTQGNAPILQASAVKRIDSKQFGRWREGWLTYRDEPLKYVVADITRYTNIKVTVNESAADVHFSGAVFKDNIDEWIAALPEVVPVAVKSDGHEFQISSKR